MYPEIYSAVYDFGICPKNIVRCKYFYIVHTEKGVYSICKARVSTNRIMEIYRVKEQLWNKGFRALDRYLPAKNSLPYVEKGGEIYILSPFKGANELDFLNNAQVIKVIETIGSMQYALSRIECQPTVRAASVSKPHPLDEMEKGFKTMKKCRKIIANTKTLKEWDMTVLKVYDKYYDKAEKAIEKLKKSTLEKCFIHNRLKEGNILFNYGRISIIDWDYMTEGSPLWDLAFFINRYKRKNAFYAHKKGLNYLNMEDILHAYSKNNYMTDNQIDDLRAVIDYPRQFIAVIAEIYRKNRKFIPIGLKMKLNEMAEQVDFELYI